MIDDLTRSDAIWERSEEIRARVNLLWESGIKTPEDRRIYHALWGAVDRSRRKSRDLGWRAGCAERGTR